MAMLHADDTTFDREVLAASVGAKPRRLIEADLGLTPAGT